MSSPSPKMQSWRKAALPRKTTQNKKSANIGMLGRGVARATNIARVRWRIHRKLVGAIFFFGWLVASAYSCTLAPLVWCTSCRSGFGSFASVGVGTGSPDPGLSESLPRKPAPKAGLKAGRKAV